MSSEPRRASPRSPDLACLITVSLPLSPVVVLLRFVQGSLTCSGRALRWLARPCAVRVALPDGDGGEDARRVLASAVLAVNRHVRAVGAAGRTPHGGRLLGSSTSAGSSRSAIIEVADHSITDRVASATIGSPAEGIEAARRLARRGGASHQDRARRKRTNEGRCGDARGADASSIPPAPLGRSSAL